MMVIFFFIREQRKSATVSIDKKWKCPRLIYKYVYICVCVLASLVWHFLFIILTMFCCCSQRIEERNIARVSELTDLKLIAIRVCPFGRFTWQIGRWKNQIKMCAHIFNNRCYQAGRILYYYSFLISSQSANVYLSFVIFIQ